MASPEKAAGGVEPDVNEIGVWGQPDRALEQADQLEAGKAGKAGEVVQAQVFGVALPHQLDQPHRDGVPSRGDIAPVAAAAMALEQPGEGIDDELVGEEAVLLGFEHPVQAAEPLDQVAIVEHALQEMRHGVDAEGAGRDR